MENGQKKSFSKKTPPKRQIYWGKMYFFCWQICLVALFLAPKNRISAKNYIFDMGTQFLSKRLFLNFSREKKPIWPGLKTSPGSVCPSPSPPTPGQPCTLPGELECHYENLIDNYGGTANCCCGQCDVDMICASDSTTGSGLWQPMHSTLCPAEGCGIEGEWWKENGWNIPLMELWLLATGEVTSPNYPGNYTNNLEKTETLQVEEGLILSLQFIAFDIESESTCDYDHLTITDGEGTTLMEKSCGSSLPANITSTSNIVKLVFITDGSVTRPGWSVSWSAVTPGECQQHVWIIFIQDIFLRFSSVSFFLNVCL